MRRAATTVTSTPSVRTHLAASSARVAMVTRATDGHVHLHVCTTCTPVRICDMYAYTCVQHVHISVYVTSIHAHMDNMYTRPYLWNVRRNMCTTCTHMSVYVTCMPTCM